MISTLVQNSETFQKKTKFSQAKFLKKKAKKYFEYLVIRRPSIRLLMQIQYKADPTKILNMREDSLSQMLSQVIFAVCILMRVLLKIFCIFRFKLKCMNLTKNAIVYSERPSIA